jgi:hypothetical protein
MKTIVLISCVSRKGNLKAKARDLYKGPLFVNSLAYAEALRPDKIFILSALYRLVELEMEIEPYNVTLSYVPPEKKIDKPDLKVLSKNEAKIWGLDVLNQLGDVADLQNDKFVFLAGKSYVNPLKHGLVNIEEPLEGLPQGKRPGKLKELIGKL